METLKKLLTSRENWFDRVVLFVIFFVIFSLGGAYNLVHLVAFCYIIYLLERTLHYKE